MKNLMIYLGESKSFYNKFWTDEPEKCVKVQIENSIQLGWKVEDILLITNFEYEYNGVKSLVVPDELRSHIASGTPSKINVILYLFEMGIIEDNIYWFHDLDAFQLVPFSINIGKNSINLTDYGICQQGPAERKKRRLPPTKRGVTYKQWNTGSIFFGNRCEDIFKDIKKTVDEKAISEELALGVLTKDRKNIDGRVVKINISYNFAFQKRDIEANYRSICHLPIKVIHFHPRDKKNVYYFNPGVTPIQVGRGDNPMKIAIVPERLRILFRKHGL